jgi:hypothetical protein
VSGLWRKARDNPILQLELRRIRRGRCWLGWGLVVYLVLWGAALIHGIALTGQQQVSPDPAPVLGFVVSVPLIVMAWLPIFVVPLIAPALAATIISGERERGTLDVLWATMLTERSIVLGKLGACLIRLWPGLLALLSVFPTYAVWVVNNYIVADYVNKSIIYEIFIPGRCRYSSLIENPWTLGAVLLNSPSYCPAGAVMPRYFSSAARAVGAAPDSGVCCPGEVECQKKPFYFPTIPVYWGMYWGSNDPASRWMSWIWVFRLTLTACLKPWSNLVLHIALGLFISSLCCSSKVALAATYGAVLAIQVALWLGQPFLCRFCWHWYHTDGAVGIQIAILLAAAWVRVIGAALFVKGAVWRLRCIKRE